MLGRLFPGFSSRSWRRQGDDDRPALKDPPPRNPRERPPDRATRQDHGSHTIDRIRHFLGRSAKTGPASPTPPGGSGWHQWRRLSAAQAQRMEAAERLLAATPKPDAGTVAPCLREVREVRARFLREIGRLSGQAGKPGPLTDPARKWLARLDALAAGLQGAAFAAATPPGHGLSEEDLHVLARKVSVLAHAAAMHPGPTPGAASGAELHWASVYARLGMRAWVLRLPLDRGPLEPCETARAHACLDLACRLRELFLSTARLPRPLPGGSPAALPPEAAKWLATANEVVAILRTRVFAEEWTCKPLLSPASLYALAAQVAFIERMATECRYRRLDPVEIDAIGAARVFIGKTIRKCQRRVPQHGDAVAGASGRVSPEAMLGELESLKKGVRATLADIDARS
ncbi:hypothetical protein [Noviherbaspirillum aridicola]|uniref:Uncharacterized protein n=1 Tax=Noviherbaspirillum aridicola TaxID=2849687 RepID=A0ABQ4Q4D5_9BURK|nr:hypothetical protein [Noviherbaspirillum aridicola]GIZ51866.1 hypothetical protein NCCP691_18800 [Noviherbaspirillum aridicola]